LNGKSIELRQENEFQEELLDELRLKNSELDKLKSMGFGLRELKTLRNLATEIMAESGQSVLKGQGVKELITDIEKHHDDYLHLRNKVSELKTYEETLLAGLTMIPRLGAAAQSFIRRGATNDDIKEMISILSAYPISSPATVSSPSGRSTEKMKEETMILRNSTDSKQGKLEQDNYSSRVRKNGVYIPAPFSEFPLPVGNSTTSDRPNSDEANGEEHLQLSSPWGSNELKIKDNQGVRMVQKDHYIQPHRLRNRLIYSSKGSDRSNSKSIKYKQNNRSYLVTEKDDSSQIYDDITDTANRSMTKNDVEDSYNKRKKSGGT
jgi:hypothetical protein